MTDNIESTGTASSGLTWADPLPEKTPDGARIVYVSIPQEQGLKSAQDYFDEKQEHEPRINALTTVIGLRQFKSDTNIEDILRDAKKVERYIRTGRVKGE